MNLIPAFPDGQSVNLMLLLSVQYFFLVCCGGGGGKI